MSKNKKKNALRGGVTVYKNPFPQRTLDVPPTNVRDDCRRQTALPSGVCVTAPPAEMSVWR
jgi:hypothetical protein